MQIVPATGSEAQNVIKVVHEDREIVWDLKLYYRNAVLPLERIFELINGYWKTLPKDRQETIFDCYLEARNALNEIADQNMMHQRLTQIVKRLYAQMPFEEIQYWARTHGNIKVPPSIKDDYAQLEISERNQHAMDYQSRTYLRNDYLDLVNLAIALRPMIPIWAEYARADQPGMGGTFREYHAMSLLRSSHLLNAQPVHRLREYIETTSPDMKTLLSAALGGLGSSELPDWVMALAIMRKLVVIELSSYEDSSNIISVIYHHVRNTIKTVDRRFASRIRDKSKPSGEDDDENKSILETYKIKQEISDGDLMVLSIYTEEPMRMAQRICPEIDVSKVKACAENIKRCLNHHPTRGQLVILRWVMSQVVPPRSIDNINKTSIFTSIAASQAVLWEWGFYDLALLMTTTETRDKSGLLIGGIESRSRIPKEYVEQFLELYPHYQEKGSKDRDRQTNVACKAIDNIAKDFVKCDWHVHAPVALCELGSTIDEMGLMNAPADIKTQLSALVLKLAYIQESMHEPI